MNHILHVILHVVKKGDQDLGAIELKRKNRPSSPPSCHVPDSPETRHPRHPLSAPSGGGRAGSGKGAPGPTRQPTLPRMVLAPREILAGPVRVYEDISP